MGQISDPFFNEKVLRWGSKGPKGGAFIFT
jgi:hypothetical protein